MRSGWGHEGGGGRWLLMMLGEAAAAADTGEGRGRGQGGGGGRGGGHGTQVGPRRRVKVPGVRCGDLGMHDLGRRREGGRWHGRRRSMHAVGAAALPADKVKVLGCIKVVRVWLRGHGGGCVVDCVVWWCWCGERSEAGRHALPKERKEERPGVGWMMMPHSNASLCLWG